MNQLSRIEVFIRVVQQGSFSAAAQALGVTKSTVSKYVALLEDETGTRLLHRTSRQVVVTEVGQHLYDRCTGLLQQAEGALREATRHKEAPRGTLRVHAPSAFARAFLTPVLADYLLTFPQVELKLCCDDREVDLIGEHFDVGLHLGRLPSSGLLSRKLGESRRCVCAAPASPEDLQRHHCPVYGSDRSPATWVLQGPDGEVAVRLHGRVRAPSGEALMELLLAGVGVGFPPSFASVPHLASGRLEPLLMPLVAEQMPSYLLFPPDSQQDPKVRAFLDLAMNHLGRTGLWVGQNPSGPETAARPIKRQAVCARQPKQHGARFL